MTRIVLYFSLGLNLILLIGGITFLNKIGGIKYLLIRLERAPNGLEFEDQVSQFKILPDIDDEIVFLGNSITSRGQWNELFNNKCLNRGIDGDDSDRILLRLDEIINRKPAKIFMMVGINDLGKDRSIEYIINNYRKIVENIKARTPTTKLYLQSVLPINNKIRNHRRSNADIIILNSGIAKLANEYDALYLDLFTKFIDSEGYLKNELTTDGMHINGKGYLVWKDVIGKYLEGKNENETHSNECILN